MSVKEEMREVLKQEFNGDFVKELPVLMTQLQDTLKQHTVVHDHILEKIDVGFTGVNVRQDVANGRTKTNEMRIAYASCGLAVVALIAIPLLSWALYSLVNIQTTVSDILEKELSTYEFELVE